MKRLIITVLLLTSFFTLTVNTAVAATYYGSSQECQAICKKACQREGDERDGDKFYCPDGMPDFVRSTEINFEGLNKSIGLTKFNSVGDIVVEAMKYIFIIAGFFLLFQLVSGGFALMFSKGDQRAVEGAKAKITNGVVGFIVLFTAYWLVQILGVVFKIPVFGQLFR